MTRNVWTLMPAFGLAMIANAACSAAPTGVADEAGDEPASETPEKTGTTTDAFTVVTSLGIWTQGGPAITLVPSKTNFCYLSRVSGAFTTPSDYVEVYDNGTNWILDGVSSKAGATARAFCIPLTMNGDHLTVSKPQLWISGLNAVELGTGGQNEVCFPTLFEGDFSGSKSFVYTYLQNKTWYLFGGGETLGVAYCVSGIKGISVTTWNEGDGIEYMEPSDSWACGISEMAGDFTSTAEDISVVNDTNFGEWYLNGTDPGKMAVFEQAYCFR
jgi:hypothetical protein